MGSVVFRRLPRTAVCLILICLEPYAAAGEVDPGALYRKALDQHGIGTGLEELHEYLRNLHPDHPRQKRVAGLIAQLGDDEFRARRAATILLGSEPEFAQVQLAAAEDHADGEIRRRAGSLRKKQQSEGDFVLFSALRCLKLHASPTSIDVILPLLPVLRDDYLIQEARAALLAGVGDENEPQLLEAFRHGSPCVRETVLLALGRIHTPQAVAVLTDSLTLANDRLALAAAEGLAWREPSSALPTLTRLLESPSFRIRHQAAALLQCATGQQFGYAPYSPEPQRVVAASDWRDWVRQDAEAAELTPLRVRPPHSGRLLLCLFRPFAVAEIDEAGNEVFRSTVTRAACGGEACPVTGHRYFADWERKSIVVLDAYGQLVDEPALPGIPNSLQLLPDGRMLTGIYNKNEVCEISPEGEVVWSAHVGGQPSDARRLANGNTLVALNNLNRVIEITREKEVVWFLDDVKSPESARRLENGNTLVACGRYARVCEFSPDKKIVWETSEKVPMAYDALLLDNGHVLIAFQAGLREVDRSGNVIRDLNLGVVRRMHRY